MKVISYPLYDVVIGIAVIAAATDLLFFLIHGMFTRLVSFVVSSVLITCLSILFLSFYKGFYWYRSALHFLYGFSVTVLSLTYGSYASFDSFMIPYISIVFSLIALTCIGVNETIVSSYTGSTFLDVCMWFGFSCGALLHSNPVYLIVCNLVILTLWFIPRQRSIFCRLWLFFCADFHLFYTIIVVFSSIVKDQKVAPANNAIFLRILATAFPHVMFYTFNFMLKNFTRGTDQDPPTRYSSIVGSRGIVRHIIIFIFFAVEAVYFIWCSAVMYHPLYWRLLLFLLVAAPWLLIHFSILSFLCRLSDKFSECNEDHRLSSDQSTGIMDVWAAKGLRALASVYCPLHPLAILTTILCFISVDDLKNWWTVTFTLLCLSIEVSLWCFTSELTYAVGGSCVGFALISCPGTPAQNNRPSTLSEALETFFTQFCIQIHDIHSTESKGLPVFDVTESLSKRLDTLLKLNEFFSLRIPGTQNRFDTYFLYRTGPTNWKGDWLMDDGSTMDLNDVIHVWEDSFRNSSDRLTGHRLILVLDQLHGIDWYQKLLVLPTQSRVALQTVDTGSGSRSRLNFVTRYLFRSLFAADDSHCTIDRVGDFTINWINWNLNRRRKIKCDGLLESVRDSSSPSSNNRTEEKTPLAAHYVITSNWSSDDASTDMNFLRVIPWVSRWWSDYITLEKKKTEVQSSINRGRLSQLFARVRLTIWIYYRRIAVHFKLHCLDTGHGFLLVDRNF